MKLNLENIEEIEPVKVIIWWQVYTPSTHNVFGFATKDGRITDFPNKKFIGDEVTKHKTWFLSNRCQVVKICEQLCP